ncbi:MAG: winged helix-turn-helix domain-containing protein [Vicingaceae bacterium]
MNKWLQIVVVGLVFFLALSLRGENSTIEQDREEVVMRKIGHLVLLQSNDSVSLVKPIVKEEDTYRIQFGASFDFQADAFIYVVDSVIKNSHLNNSYLVKVEHCETKEVVYSYEVDVFAPDTILDEFACKSRPYPEDCYEVVIQFFKPEEEVEESSSSLILFFIGVLAILIIIIALRKKKVKAEKDKNKIKLGDYLYDPKKMVLIRKEKTIELTSKESELLNLLYASANETVERDIILNKVWGDEGDYVGRTLDVYVSKLRKKLENDASIELKNIRGIGYKLIIED